MGFVINIDDTAFESIVIKQKKPSLVFFSAPWCKAGKASRPVLDQLVDVYTDYGFYYFDIDSSTPNAVSVKAVPTVMIFKNGVMRAQLLGLLTSSSLAKLLDNA